MFLNILHIEKTASLSFVSTKKRPKYNNLGCGLIAILNSKYEYNNIHPVRKSEFCIGVLSILVLGPLSPDTI